MLTGSAKSFYADYRLMFAVLIALVFMLLPGCSYFSSKPDELVIIDDDQFAFVEQEAEVEPVVANKPREQEVAQVVDSPWQVIRGGVEGNMFTGYRPVRFVEPVAVAARNDIVLIVDNGRDVVYRYDRLLDQLSVLVELRDIVKAEVSDIYLDHDMSFYVVDADGRRILHFNAKGSLIRIISNPQLVRPIAIAFDDGGSMYIADGFSDDVLVLNAHGLLEGVIGRRGDGQRGEFLGVTSMTNGPSGIYVTTRFGDTRVQVMTREGRYRGSFQQDSVTFPTAIVVDAKDRAFISDYMDDTIKVYQKGRWIGTLGGSGSAPGKFKRISDLWLDGDQLYVADSLNRRIQVLHVPENFFSKAPATP